MIELATDAIGHLRNNWIAAIECNVDMEFWTNRFRLLKLPKLAGKGQGSCRQVGNFCKIHQKLCQLCNRPHLKDESCLCMKQAQDAVEIMEEQTVLMAPEEA